jgi:Fic-DOC domain mobile mystery protein B
VRADLFAAGEGNTPLSAEEQAELIPDLSTREELNEWERQNIVEASVWAFASRGFAQRDPLTEPYVRELHRRMFDQTWRWAGSYRHTDKNLGIAHFLVRDRLASLLGDVRYWIDHAVYPPDEIAVRFHHRLVSIHPFPNGNGRHARLIADVLAKRLGVEVFTWGSEEIAGDGEIRRRYIAALQAADRHDLEPLLKFARS